MPGGDGIAPFPRVVNQLCRLDWGLSRLAVDLEEDPLVARDCPSDHQDALGGVRADDLQVLRRRLNAVLNLACRLRQREGLPSPD